MPDWENLRYLLALGRAGTLSGAARDLGVDHATVSRRLGALETELQVPLVERLPRSCRLTPVGTQIFEQAKAMESAAFGVERLARAAQHPLVGDVRLSAPPVLVAHLLAGRMAEFQRASPGIRLSLLAQAQQISLSRRDADLALRLVRPEESDCFIRKVGHMPFALYASRSFQAARRPAEWTFIAYGAELHALPQQQWLMEVAAGRAVSCALSDITSHVAAARSGAGVAGLPCFIGDAEPGLVRLAPAAVPFSRDLWLLVHRDLRRTAPVRGVMDFISDTIAGQAGLRLAS